MDFGTGFSFFGLHGGKNLESFVRNLGMDSESLIMMSRGETQPS